MRLLCSDVVQPVPLSDAELGVDVVRVGGMHQEPHDGCDQEAAYSREQDLRPVDAVILQDMCHIERMTCSVLACILKRAAAE